jgi:hypothetical protein
LSSFTITMIALIGAAVGVFLIVVAFVFGANSRRAKRYRPGRPFEFTPVWFIAATRRQSPDKQSSSKELATGPARATRRRGETGGASDRW